MKASIGFVLKAWLLPASAITWMGYAEPASAQQPSTVRSATRAIAPADAPRRLTARGASEAAAIQLVADNQPKSAVQQQLEALYKKEGREMPAMNLSDLPDGEYQAPPLPNPAAYPPSAYSPSTYPQSGYPQGQQGRSAESEKQPNFLQRLFMGSQKPAESQPRSTGTRTYTGRRSATSFGRITGRRGRGAASRPAPVATKEPAAIEQQPQYRPSAPAVAAPRQLPNFGVAANSDVVAPEPLPISDADEPAQELPALTQDETPRLELEGDDEAIDDLDAELFKDAVPANPSVAGNKPANPPATEQSPFSGLTLQTPDVDATPELKPVPDEDAFPKLAEEEQTKDPQEEKYRILANSPETVGFKGFCPVRLTNDRELIVALPAYEAEFESNLYTFSSAEAKAEFEKSPSKYAPVSGGIDIVLFQEEETTRVGSLDFAAWYKGRLYLFATEETMLAFMAKPKEYVELDRPVAPPAIINPAGQPADELGFEDSLGLPEVKAPVERKAKPAPAEFAEELPRLELNDEEATNEPSPKEAAPELEAPEFAAPAAKEEAGPFFAPEVKANVPTKTAKPADPFAFEEEFDEAEVIDSKEWKPAAKTTEAKPASAKPAAAKPAARKSTTKSTAKKPATTTTTRK